MSLRTNVAIVGGRLGRDPEIKYSSSGMAIANFSLAHSEARKKEDGTWDEHTNWFNVVAFAGLAERIGEHMHKGSEVSIEGRLRYEEWESQEGGKRSRVVIVASRVDTPATPKDAGAKEESPAEQSQDDSPAEKTKAAEEDDLPF